MLCFPNAKINLGLSITEKRPDGYHNIESIFVPISLREGLEAVLEPNLPNGHLEFSFSGNPIPGNSNENLCIKAHAEIVSRVGELPGLKAHLHKIIPIGAGLGGGSADAAFFINLINALCELNLPEQIRLEIASSLGSDCAFFIKNESAFCFGRGELTENVNLPLKGLSWILLCPSIHISTKEAYANVVPKPAKFNLRNIAELPISDWKKEIVNDFETSLFPNFPQIAELKESLYNLGAAYAAMSGSGSAVYGIFTQKPSTDSYLNARDLVVFEGNF